MSFQKAYLIVERPKGKREQINVWFNPTSLNVTTTARWDDPVTLGETDRVYVGGDQQALRLKFLFHAEGLRTGEHVQAGIDAMRSLLVPVLQDGKPPRMRPPKVEFVWGTWSSAPSVVTAVDVTIELFDGAGLPLRAWVALTMSRSLTDPEQAAKKKATNPTTQATRLRSSHAVAPGEDIALIAHRHYRTPTRWREIAEMNDLDDPLRVDAPALLIVPLEESR